MTDRGGGGYVEGIKHTLHRRFAVVTSLLAFVAIAVQSANADYSIMFIDRKCIHNPVECPTPAKNCGAHEVACCCLVGGVRKCVCRASYDDCPNPQCLNQYLPPID